MLAAIRPDSWNFPLLLHVLGASVLLGAVITALTAQLLGWNRRTPSDVVSFARFSFRTLLFVAIPAWFLMRIAGEWIASREGLNDLDDPPGWLDIGYIVGDASGLFLLISVILAGLGARNLGRSNGERGATLVRVATVLVVLLVIAFVIATWAMAGKPD
ncbi:MAG: hypothetical protein ACRDLZ_02130 [Gaiellaceae bacterium]